MDYQDIREDLKNLVSPVLEKEDMELVELIFIRRPSGSILRLLVDKKTGGISLDECARLNERINSLLDVQDIIKERYILEVSSPGLDRPLKDKNDFLRCMDRRARFFFNEPINGKCELEGIINKVEDCAVYIDTGSDKFEIPLSKVRKAKQIF